MFKFKYMLALALLCMRTPLALCGGGVDTARLRWSVGTVGGNGSAPVQGHVDAENTHVLAQPAFCRPPRSLAPTPVGAEVAPIPPPAPPPGALRWPPPDDPHRVFDYAYRPPKPEPRKAKPRKGQAPTDDLIDRFWDWIKRPLSYLLMLLRLTVMAGVFPLVAAFYAMDTSACLCYRITRAFYQDVREVVCTVCAVGACAYMMGCLLTDAMLFVPGFCAAVVCPPKVAPARPSRRVVQVFVKMQVEGGGTQTLTVDDVTLSDTAGEFKKQLAAKVAATCALPEHETYTPERLAAAAQAYCAAQRLIFKGKEIADDLPLTAYGVRKASTLHGVLRLRAGMPSAGASSSSDPGPSGSGGVQPMSLDQLQRQHKRSLDAKNQRTVVQRIATEEEQFVEDARSKTKRAALREKVGEQLKECIFADSAPNLTNTALVLKRISQLVSLQDTVRDGQGALIQALFKRCDTTSALARDQTTGEGDLDGASQVVLPSLLSFYDYYCARVGDKKTVDKGREEGPNGGKHEAPPHPRCDGGYRKLKDAIEGAYNNREEFWAWCEERWPEAYANAMGKAGREADGKTCAKRLSDAKLFLPAGDIVLPPLCITGEARESKSFLILALVGLVLQIPNVRVAISVAPYKIAAINEMKRKLDIMGWEKVGYAKVKTTLNLKIKKGEQIPDAVVDDKADCNIFLYSHDELRDTQVFDKVLKKWRQEGCAVLSIHDEADTLIKAFCRNKETGAGNDPSKDTILRNLRSSYSPYYARTVLVGATQLATLQEKAIWGTQLLAFSHDDLGTLQPEKDDPRPNITMTIPPLKPPKGTGALYVGLNKFLDFEYAEHDPRVPLDPNAVTSDNIDRAMVENRFDWVTVHTEYWQNRIDRLKVIREMTTEATTASGEQREAALKPNGQPRVNNNKEKKPLYFAETQQDAEARYKAQKAVLKKELRNAEAFDHNKQLPLFTAGARPQLPDGLCTPWQDEIGFAMITQRIRTFLSRPDDEVLKEGEPAKGFEDEEHCYSEMLVMAPTHVSRPLPRDPAGGLVGYGRHVINLAKKLKKPTVVMMYVSTSAGTVAKALGKDNGVTVKERPKGEPKQEGDSVKMVVVLPIESPDGDPAKDPDSSDDDDDGGPSITGYHPNQKFKVEWVAKPLEVHGSAREALTAAHSLMVLNGCADRIRQLNVVAIGYGLFSAALTLSVSDLELPPEAGVSQKRKTERVHYIPKSMVFCTAEDKNPATQYQMLGRCMNTLLAFFPRERNGYTIDVLTHKDTLSCAKIYYEVERYLMRLWSGEKEVDPETDKLVSGRIPHNLITALHAFTHGLAEKHWAELIDKGIGFRKESLATTLHSACGEGAALYDDEDLPDNESDSGDVNPFDVDAMEEEPPAPKAQLPLLKDLVKCVNCIGRPESWWPRFLSGPSWKEPGAKWDAPTITGLRTHLTAKEKSAIGMDNSVKNNTQAGGKVYRYLASPGEFAHNYRDLVVRVMPAYFLLVCRLLVVRSDAAVNDALVKKCKKTAFEICKVTLDAFKYLIYTTQFNPDNGATGDMFWKVRELAIQLGEDCSKRKERLQHMFRALRWIDLSGPSVEHTNYVTAMGMLLNRILLVPQSATLGELATHPWNLPIHPTALAPPTMERNDELDNAIKSREPHRGEDHYEHYEPYHLRKGEELHRDTYYGKMTLAMRKEVMDRFPDEITSASLNDFERAMKSGINDTFTACDTEKAHKYRGTLMRGLYHCIKISEGQEAGSPFKIADGASALDVIKQRIEQGMRPADAQHGRAVGLFYDYCTTHPTPEKPYAHLPPIEGNPSAVTNWLQGFERWAAVHSQ